MQINIFVILFLFFNGYAPVYASLIAIEDQGQLIGFDGITLNNEDYNVRFVDGTYLSVFGATGLDFSLAQDAGNATIALEEAFNANPLYDLNPQFTSGLTYDGFGYIHTPYSYEVGDYSVPTFFFQNFGGTNDYRDTTGHASFITTKDLSTGFESHIRVWADWSLASTSGTVPEPSILALRSLGILGLGLSRRKIKK